MPNEHQPSTTRRQFLQGAMSIGVASALSADAKAEALRAPEFRPNIVYIHSHDTGRYLQPYGESVPSPRIQTLASQGVLFRQAFSGAPTCSPARACLLTGQSAHASGMLGLAHLGWELHDYQQVLIHTLHPHGYTSALAGLQHIAKDPKTIGYKTYIPHKSNNVVDVVPGAVEYLKAQVGGQPFFLDVGFRETHREYAKPTAADVPAFIKPPLTVPDVPETRFDMACFHASARALDEGVGAVMDALERYGLAENTLVISTTDHGIAFPRMKCSLTDNGWGVHLVMRGPREFSKPMVCNAMISQVDLFPTLCDYLQIEKPAWLEGKSFLPVIRDETEEIHDEIFAEVTYHASYEPKRAVRTKRWKYIKRFDGRTHAVLPNTDDGPSKDVWLKSGWQALALEHEESLYDLVFDPNEQNNLSKDGAYQAKLEEMRGRLESWMKRTNDPILNGPVSLPPGGRSRDVNAISVGKLVDEVPGPAVNY